MPPPRPPSGSQPKPVLRSLTPVPLHRGHSPVVAADIDGRTLAGRRTTIAVAGPGRHTLLLFLSAHCDGCTPLWQLVRCPESHGLAGVRVVAVVDPSTWRQRVAIGRRAGAAGWRSVVRSGAAFTSYRVHAPFFVVVDGDGPSVAIEGVAWDPVDVVHHVDRARNARSEP